MGLQFVIRVDASSSIGTGHVMRCLTLAGVLQEKGSEVTFICREHNDHLCDLIEMRGFVVHRLSKPKFITDLGTYPPHAEWLGVSWTDDGDQTSAFLKKLDRKPDWLIVDHYALDYRWEQYIRPYVGKIFVIDDLADRVHDCDLLLDQNLVSDMNSRYAEKIPSLCRQIIGPKYALLRPVYADLHQRVPPRDGPVRRILIFFGETDSVNLTFLTVSAFMNLNHQDIEVDLIISMRNPHISQILKLVDGHSNIHIHYDLPSLALLMVKADLAIGAAGTTSWERLCLGLPSVVITLADNQRPIAEGLNRNGLIRWIGHKDDVTEEKIFQILKELLANDNDKSWSILCRGIVDGKGVFRVCSALTLVSDTPLYIRLADMSDEELLLEWANDPDTRQNSVFPESITPQIYLRWFYGMLRDVEGCRFYLIETEEGIPIGQVWFEKQDEGWDIDYSIVPHMGGRGLGQRLLQIALSKMRLEHEGVVVFGKVKKNNFASQYMLKSNGFRDRNGEKFCITICSDSGSWMNFYIPELILNWLSDGHEVRWAHDAGDVRSGDICFYLSYGKIVDCATLKKHMNNVVVHESDLPKGKGWSPMTWQVLEGGNLIPVTLFEANEKVDSGVIYLQGCILLNGNELVDEIRHLQAETTFRLCKDFVDDYPGILGKGRNQFGESTFYRRRTPADGALDPSKTIISQFNLFRISDNERYPAWFEVDGNRFVLRIYKINSA